MKKINHVTITAVATKETRPFFEMAGAPSDKTLPTVGMSRWGQIAPFMPISREKFRQLVNAGKAPPAVRLSERCTCYSNRELHKFFSDPLNYSVGLK